MYEKLKEQYTDDATNKREMAQRKTLDDFVGVLDKVAAIKGNESFNASPLLFYGHLALKQIWSKVLKLDYKFNFELKREFGSGSFKVSDIAFFFAVNKIIAPTIGVAPIDGRHTFCD